MSDKVTNKPNYCEQCETCKLMRRLSHNGNYQEGFALLARARRRWYNYRVEVLAAKKQNA